MSTLELENASAASLQLLHGALLLILRACVDGGAVFGMGAAANLTRGVIEEQGRRAGCDDGESRR